ncbi:unnamed protein product, partial [Effrenium voratum]
EPELEEDEECWLEESECEQRKESITVEECRRRQRYKMDKFDTYEAVDEQQAQGKQILDRRIFFTADATNVFWSPSDVEAQEGIVWQKLPAPVGLRPSLKEEGCARSDVAPGLFTHAHMDDIYGSGPEDVAETFLESISKKVIMKYAMRMPGQYYQIFIQAEGGLAVMDVY